MKAILKVENLNTRIREREKTLIVADKIDFELGQNEILGVVGESGGGKTMTAFSLTGLVPGNAEILCSGLFFEGKKIDPSHPEEIKKIRAKGISYIFQEATTYINPLFSVGDQIKECIRYNLSLSEKEAKREAQQQLETVGLVPAQEYYHRFSHQLSGGMNQRVMIAMAISSRPKILIADEPTSALDVTIEQSIVCLIQELVKKMQFSCIWITHDISLIQSFADRIAVMVAARIVEIGKSSQVYQKPAHPYTKALIACLPENLKLKRFAPIQGDVPDLSQLPPGCKFNPRCPYRMAQCLSEEPNFFDVDKEQRARCFLLQKS